ncbi:MAG: TonB-dependent receptor [Caulobacteraceae bacterium]|jgi:iron complex outermembrane receptor protein|nr:TonB-dependent receptor [Caulobacteraceae bacterium]
MRYVVLSVSLLASTVLAGQAFAQDIAPVKEVVVVGQNKTKDGVSRIEPGGGLISPEVVPRVRETVTRDFIAKQAPSSNPEQLLMLQPSANIVLGDPFGLAKGRMTVRGLDIGEIGFMFEGMPFNNGEVYPNEVLDSENLSSISLTPGSIDFDVPSFGAVGGLVEMKYRDPAMKPGGFVNLSAGSDRFNSEFVRLDSGDIANTGARAFISASQTRADFWHGPGYDGRTNVDFKVIKEWAEGTESALSVAWNRQVFALDRWPTLAQWNTSGLGWVYDRNFTTGDTNFWALHESAFGNVAVSAPNRFKLSSDFDLAVTPYLFHGYGTSPGGSVQNNIKYSGPTALGPTTTGYTPVAGASGPGLDLSGQSNSGVFYALTLYDQYRTGVNAALNYHIAGHTFTVGYWYEYDYATTKGALDFTGSSGMPNDLWGGQGLVHLTNGQLYYSSNTKTLAEVNGVYVGDRASLFHDRLELDYGFKEVSFDQQGYNYIPGETYRRNANFSIPLPTAAARWRFDSENQVYANVGTNFLTPQSSQLFDVYSNATGVQTQQGALYQKPEYSVVEEIGYRYEGKLLTASVSAFNYDFRDRQISTSILQNGGFVTEYLNAGGQNSKGVDFEAGLRPWHSLRPFVSGEYLDATIKSNLPGLNTANQLVNLPTSGKVAVRSPKEMASLGLDYDNGTLFTNFIGHWTASQYSTFMNDQQIPAYATANMTFGYRMKNLAWAKTPVIQLNLVNITNNKYLGGVYTVQNNAKAATAVNGTTVNASGLPTYVAGAGFAAIVSVSASF